MTRMRRWLLLIGAVLLGVAGGILLFTSGRSATETPNSLSPSASESESAQRGLQLESPVPLIEPDSAQRASVTVTDSAGGKLLVGTETGEVYVAQMPSGLEPIIIPEQPFAQLSARVSDLATSSDGEVYAAVSIVDGSLVVATDDGVIGGAEQSEYSTVALSADGRLLALGGFGVTTFDLMSDAAPIEYEQPMIDGGRGTYEAVTFSSDGSVVAASLEGVDKWKAGSGTPDGTTRSCGCAARTVTLSDDGRHAIFGTADGHIVVLDVQSGNVLVDRTVSSSPNDLIWAVDLTSDTRLAIGISSNGAGLIWDLDQDVAAWRGDVPFGSVSGVYFTDEGMIIETQEDDFAIQVWRASLSIDGEG